MPTWASRALGPLNMPVKPHSLQVLQDLALVRVDRDQSEVHTHACRVQAHAAKAIEGLFFCRTVAESGLPPLNIFENETWKCGIQELEIRQRRTKPPSLVVLAQQGLAHNPLSTRKLDRLLPDLILHRLFAKHALQLDNLGAGGSQFARRPHRFTSGHGGERTFTFELAPVEQLTCAETLLARHQQHAYPWLIRFAHQHRLFLGRLAQTTLHVHRHHSDGLLVPSHISLNPLRPQHFWGTIFMSNLCFYTV